MTLKCLAAKITPKRRTFDHIVWRKEWNNAIKRFATGFAENKGQSVLSVVSKTKGKCQFSVKF